VREGKKEMDHNANRRYFVTMKVTTELETPAPATAFTLQRLSLCTALVRKLAVLTMVAFLFAACSSEKSDAPASVEVTAAPAAPSLEEARALLATAPEFADYQFTYASIALPLDRSRMNEPAKAAARDLEKAGWIETQRDKIVLSSKSAEDKRFNVRPNGFLEIVPLAKKEITEVGAVTEGTDGKPSVTFCWRWIPNAVGVSLTKGAQKDRFDAMHCAKASLIRIGDKWEVLAIEETVSKGAGG